MNSQKFDSKKVLDEIGAFMSESSDKLKTPSDVRAFYDELEKKYTKIYDQGFSDGFDAGLETQKAVDMKKPHNMKKGDTKTFDHLGQLEEFARTYNFQNNEFEVYSENGKIVISKI